MLKIKKLIPMAAIMIMLTCSSVFASGVSLINKTATITVGGLNVRKTPKIESGNVISTVSKGANFQIVGQQSGWYKIKLSSNKYGWVSSKYVKLNSQVSKEEAEKVKRDKIVKLAKAQIGKPYVWGAQGPRSFDCSGLVTYVYKNAGDIKAPRTSAEQSKMGTTVKRSNLKPGDLVFSSTNGTGRVSHVGIYVGSGQMIHAPRAGSVVQKTSINTTYWNKAYLWSKDII
ncbi:C40 family peptidase [Clostridium cylindrosporum]|uniref:Murein DD-endopeptidase MepH n=1 Tax=Clostridium cylindrosporum DSM 605 TaxID=1121307 RepID=A0A0J8D7L2_CLOCY|nr:C40 family peptidase [Clostridium cylindrosporum]KMT22020.1 murein DD-endopeptidase MepH [Clostridium cylindrosporum DSM 605]